MLNNKAVQEDLKLSEDQVKQVADMQKAEREALQGLAREDAQKKRQELNQENAKKVKELLKPEQAKRLEQIRIQSMGVTGAAANPEISKQLNITDDQKEQIRTLQQEMRTKMQELFQGGAINEENQKKIAELRKDVNAKAAAMLTADQKTKWKEMTGEPFKGEFNFGPVGGRRPGGNRPTAPAEKKP